jgi:hypothetical protein
VGAERCTSNETSSKKFQFFFLKVYEHAKGTTFSSRQKNSMSLS